MYGRVFGGVQCRSASVNVWKGFGLTDAYASMYMSFEAFRKLLMTSTFVGCSSANLASGGRIAMERT